MTKEGKRKIYSFVLVVLILSNLLGIALSDQIDVRLFYNFTIMPAIGAIGFFMLKRSWNLIPLVIFILYYFGQLIVYATDRLDFSLATLRAPFLLSSIYAGLCILGIAIAALLKFSFQRKKQTGSKLTKIVAALTAFLLIGGILFLTNILGGNPVSKVLANVAAKKHVEENYPNISLELESAIYDFKSGKYLIQVQSTENKNTQFSIRCNSLGKVVWDNYE